MGTRRTNAKNVAVGLCQLDKEISVAGLMRSGNITGIGTFQSQ